MGPLVKFSEIPCDNAQFITHSAASFSPIDGLNAKNEEEHSEKERKCGRTHSICHLAAKISKIEATLR